MLVDGLSLVGTGEITNARIEQVTALPTLNVGAGRAVYLTIKFGSFDPGLYIANSLGAWTAVGSVQKLFGGQGIVVTSPDGQTTISIDPNVVVLASSLGAADGVATLDESSKLTTGQLPASVLLTSAIGAASGLAYLDAQKKLTESQLPSTVLLSTSVGLANGVATLDAQGKLAVGQIPASLIGAVVYQGTWNAATNVPTLASGTGTKGHYYKVSVTGTRNLDGTTLFQIGDTVIFNGSVWDKIDGIENEIVSVAGRSGVITLSVSDVSGALASNSAITGNTFPKITFDSKGLVTSGSALVAADIPSLDFSKITTGKPTTLVGYGITNALQANAGIAGSSATKITYDSKGLVTAGTTLAPGDIPPLDYSILSTGRPTTVAGYGITDVYTKSEVNAVIVANSTSRQTVRSTTPGVLTVADGTARLYPAAPMTLVSISANVNTASGGSDIKLDVKKNGVSILGGTLLTIAQGTNVSTTLANTTQVTVTDYLTVDILQVGSVVPGSDLVVTLYYA